MTAKHLDERIATLNHILFQKEDLHPTSEGAVVVLRDLDKSKTSINSIQKFFSPQKLNYVRIFEEPCAPEDSLNFELRKFNILASNPSQDAVASGSADLAPAQNRATVSVLVEFESTTDLEPYFRKLSQTPNTFGSNKISKEIIGGATKGEPSSLLNSPLKVLYDSIVVENINEFFGHRKLRMAELDDFLSKFKLFGSFDAIYFPIKSKDEEGKLDFKSVGFIGFAHKPDINESILKCLYYLHDLDYNTFQRFCESDITDISHKPTEASEDSDSAKLKLSICQKKHKPFLFNNSTGVKIGGDFLEVVENHTSMGDPADEEMFKRFSKTVNFQQSNIYVNNLPTVFQNDDTAWFDFWVQFGTQDCIKSAKIIKPQFYSRRQNSPYGKFGFVFYNNLKPALKAILLTNNRLVSGFSDYPKFHIEASFAIQKSTADRLQGPHVTSSPRHEGYMSFPFGPPLHYSPQNNPGTFPMPIYNGYGYHGAHFPDAKPRSKSVSGNPSTNASNQDSMPPFDNYYNYYMAMPYPMQAGLAPNGAFAPVPFQNSFAYASQCYYPVPYHPGVPGEMPNVTRRTSE